MKLYYNPKSRAVVAKWMLDECGAQYEIVPISLEARENKSPEFLKINPSGKLPALVDGSTRIFESAAIGLYLGDRYPWTHLAPSIDSPDRGRYLALMVYSTSQLEPSMGDALLKENTSPSRGWTDFETTKTVIESELGERDYLFDSGFTLADIMIGSMLTWARMWGAPLGRPKLDAYVERLSKRPHAMKFG